MKRRYADPLLAHVENYFTSYLRQVRGASPHTIRAYRDGLQLFFLFLAKRMKIKITKLGLEDIKAESVLAFLNHLESERSNQSATRNCRLAAIRGLAAHLLRQDLSHAEQYRQILALPAKRSIHRPASYVEPEEMREILRPIKGEDLQSLRDRALLLFLYNTGVRISEALAINFLDIRESRPPQVRILGKGRKERYCPLWKETALLICRLHSSSPGTGDQPLFVNKRGTRLTRDGAAYILAKYVRCAALKVPGLRQRKITPHSLRHGCAVALLQSGADLTVIRDYLGHASISTTNHYVTANFQTKKKALQAFWKRASLDQGSYPAWKPSPNMLDFLQSL